METVTDFMKLVCFGSAVVLFVVLGRVLGMKEGDGE